MDMRQLQLSKLLQLLELRLPLFTNTIKVKKIYHINGKAVEVFNDTFGGNLKFTADGLLTFQPEKHFMCRFRNNILQPK